MKKTYIAKESRLPARKRSKKLQNTATTASTVSTTTSVSGETLWHKETDEATQEVSAKADLPAKVMRRLTLVSDDGETVTLSVSQGRLHVDKSVVSSADMVAYGTEESEVTTVEDLIRQVVEQMCDAGDITPGAGIKSVALDYDSALYKFRVHIIDSNNKNYYSGYVDLPIETVVSKVNTAQATADTAKTTADSANSKVDNLQIGGRNYILNSAKQVMYSVDNTSSWVFGISEEYATIASGTDMYLTFNCVNTITSGRLRLRCRIAGRGNSIDTNLGDFDASSVSAKYTYAVKCKGVYTGQVFYVENYDAVGGLTIANVKLELGNKATDWTPAPEDVEEEISRTKTKIINGNVASATKLQTPRALWGQSFNGTADVNGDMVFATGTNGRVLRVLKDGSFRLQAPTTGDWVCGFLGRNAANTANLAGFGVFGTANTINYYYMGIGHGAPCLKVTPAGNMTINGSMVAKGDVTAYSDARVKSDIEELSPRDELRPVSYIKDGRRGIGFIAQEVREVYPELVREDEDGMLSLNYNGLVAVLYAEVQELRQALREIKG